MRLIDADSLNNYKFGYGFMSSSYADGWDDAIDTIMKDAPTVNDRPEGSWIRFGWFFYCSHCFENVDNDIERMTNFVSEKTEFCSICGAHMKKEEAS